MSHGRHCSGVAGHETVRGDSDARAGRGTASKLRAERWSAWLAACSEGSGSETITADQRGLDADGTWAPGGDRYELRDELARGGGGRIVIALDRKLDRIVAVKLPLETAGSATRLMREAQLVARLEHPSIVPVPDLGCDEDGRPFYVMKLLGGTTLHARFDERPFEDRISLLPIVAAVADAIAYAHSRGVIHRDLKPSNVLVGEFGEVAVIDWGLARLT